MLLVKITDGVADIAPITLENFLLLYPSTSFPGYLDASITEPLGWGIFTYTQVPEFDRAIEKIQELPPIRNDETGVWEQKWEVVPLSVDEKRSVDAIRKKEMVMQRNMLLIRTDWTQLPDAPLTDELKSQWSDYRQQLRQLPDTAAFDDVWNISWPKQPHPLMGDEQEPPNVI